MKFQRLAITSVLSALIALGCADGAAPIAPAQPPLSPPLPSYAWKGQLNARDGVHHQGDYLLTVSPVHREISGEYRLELDRCIKHGIVKGTLVGTDLAAMVTEGGSVMEIKAAVVGDDLFGTYRYLSGPCKGDWGSTVAKRTSQTD